MMTIGSVPPSYQPPSPTQEQLEFADLATIDLSKADTLEGRIKLAAEVTEALKTTGFFYVINHGYTSEQTNQIFSLAKITFDEVSEEEKAKYTIMTDMSYYGYKPKQTWFVSGTVRDQIEHFEVARHFDSSSHPEALRPYHSYLDNFVRHNHFNILHPILRLLALGLELSEDTLVNQHTYDAPGEAAIRFGKYHPRSTDEEVQSKNIWLKGHTDAGSITILWSQPISGLQILSLDGKWRWIRHMENALVINAGDVIATQSRRFYPATRHRVVQPAADQRDIPRYGIFYFAMPDDDVKLAPLEDSPVLKKLGVPTTRLEDVPTMEQYRKGRTKTYGKVQYKQKEEGVEEEVVSGLVVNYYT